MTYIDEKDLKNVNGAGIGGILNSEDIMKYIQVLTERPGIVDRILTSTFDDEDEQAALRHFNSAEKFIVIAGFAHDKTVEELMAIAASNSKKLTFKKSAKNSSAIKKR